MKNKTLNEYKLGELHILNHLEARLTHFLDKERNVTLEQALQRGEHGSFDVIRERYETCQILLEQITQLKEQLENE